LQRGKKLRARVSVTEDSCLKPKHFRNHFEHYDERIQEWFDSSRPAGFADFCIGWDDSFGGGLGQPHFMRNFNPHTQTLYFRGERYEFPPVVVALRQLRERATQELENERSAREAR